MVAYMVFYICGKEVTMKRKKKSDSKKKPRVSETVAVLSLILQVIEFAVTIILEIVFRD